MWPFSRSLSSTIEKDEDITDAQVKAYFGENIPKGSHLESSSGAPDITQSQHKTPPKVKEDPCSLQYYFDEFFMCYTPKAQLQNWYRYGEKKDCAERWQDFKWCMKTRMVEDETSQEMLSERKHAMNTKVHNGPNSEDIWDARAEHLIKPWGGAEEDVSIS